MALPISQEEWAEAQRRSITELDSRQVEAAQEPCWCGHDEGAHLQDQETDLDGRPDGHGVYTYCVDCMQEDSPQKYHEFTPAEGTAVEAARCKCGHTEDAHSEGQEMDLDGRPTSPVYPYCYECQIDDRDGSAHAFEPASPSDGDGEACDHRQSFTYYGFEAVCDDCGAELVLTPKAAQLPTWADPDAMLLAYLRPMFKDSVDITEWRATLSPYRAAIRAEGEQALAEAHLESITSAARAVLLEESLAEARSLVQSLHAAGEVDGRSALIARADAAEAALREAEARATVLADQRDAAWDGHESATRRAETAEAQLQERDEALGRVRWAIEHEHYGDLASALTPPTSDTQEASNG